MRRYALNNLVVCCLFGLFAILAVDAQDAQDAKAVRSAIRSIKLDGRYVYGESSQGDHDTAYKNAVVDLLQSINALRSQAGKSPLALVDLKGNVLEYTYSRADCELVFAYILVDDALKIAPLNFHTSIPQPSQQPEPGDQNPPVPAIQNPPVPDYQNPPVPDFQDQPEPDAQTARNHQLVTANVLERQMAANAWQYLASAKDMGLISSLSKAKVTDTVPTDAFIIIVNHEYNILAVLSPYVDGQRKNLRTNQYDDISNYSHVALIWYK